MDKWFVSFVSASFLSLLWPALPSPIFVLLLTLVALFCLLSTKCRPVSGFLFGCVWMASVGHWQLSWQLPLEQLRQVVETQGRIASLIHNEDHAVFELKTKYINGHSYFVPRNIRLTWRQPSWQLKQGQVVSLAVKLKPNHGLANEGGFSYEKWLISRGIAATGYVKTNGHNQLIKNETSLRQVVRDRINEYGLANEKWILALAIGDRSGLEREDWTVIQHTGVAHLMAISGLHLGIVASFSYLIFSVVVGFAVKFLRYHRQVNLRVIGLLVSCITACFYANLAGLELPVLRATIAISFFTALVMLRSYWRKSQFLLICLFVFVILFPLSIYSVSFWLSFGAVSAIVFVLWRQKNADFRFTPLNALIAMIKVQFLLTLLMMPLIAWQFGLVSLLSPLVNLVAIPVVTILLVPICLVSVVCILINQTAGQAMLAFLDLLFIYLLQPLFELQASQVGMILLKNIGGLPWLLVGLYVVLFALPIKTSRRYMGLLLILPVFSHLTEVKKEGWQLDVLDVGQGLSVLVSRQGRAVLYDTGASFPSGFNMADAVVLPLLAARGIKHLDMVIISHFDNDHAGSLQALQEGISIGQIISSKNVCEHGWTMQWQSLHFEALWPAADMHQDGNNGSCVVRIYDNQHQVLLPGDIERSAELALVRAQSEKLDSDVLLAPHHGSNTSSSSEFLNAVKPSISIFSEGFMNRWDFPPKHVIRRYLDVGSRLYSTSESGQISVFFSAEMDKPIKVTRFRQDQQRFWYVK